MAGGGLTAGIGAYFWDVANDLPLDMTRPRAERLAQLIPSLRALLEGETSGGANLANAAAATARASKTSPWRASEPEAGAVIRPMSKSPTCLK